MDSLIGKLIDNYQIIEVIGRGGMGVVFKAMDTNLEKIVALKMIDPFLARDISFVRRFKTEAKALAKLENSHIVAVHALRETEDGLFMVMEYVESKPLSQLLKENGSFSTQQILSISEQLLDAIDHAHAEGIIHRDIKPANILLCDNGKVKVTDFGLAKVVQQKGEANTITQTVAGTLYYMSPEQIKGLRNVDNRSDLYSIGMTMYEMTAGRVPFDKTDSDFTIQKKIVEGEIPSPGKFNPVIPKKLVKIINKAIENDPLKRYQTAQEMLGDIQNLKRELSEEKPVKAAKLIKPPKTKEPPEEKKPLNKSKIFIPLAFLILVVSIYFLFQIEGTPDKIVNITTFPPGADLVINGESTGKTPLMKFITGEDELTLRIQKDGYLGIDTIIAIKDSVSTFPFSLIRQTTYQFGINTDPAGAKVFLDNNFIGNSPLENFSYPEGEFNLKIEKEGYQTFDTLIKIDRLFTGVNKLPLKKAEDKEIAAVKETTPTGGIKITSDPQEALIWLNGVSYGSTPFENKDIAPGTYKLVLKKKGYLDLTENIKVAADKVSSLNKKLNPAGNILITSEPSGAEVMIDNIKVGSTSYSSEKISLGEHSIKISKAGYKTLTDKFKLADNKKLTLTYSLEAITAAVELLVRPYGSIYIDEQLKIKDSNSRFTINLPGGKHKLKVVHPTLGTYSKEISITDDQIHKYLIDLSRIARLTIVSNPINSEILINGVSSGKYSPSQLKLLPGSYKIILKKDGYEPSKEINYEVPMGIYELSSDKEDRLEFTLNKLN